MMKSRRWLAVKTGTFDASRTCADIIKPSSLDMARLSNEERAGKTKKRRLRIFAHKVYLSTGHELQLTSHLWSTWQKLSKKRFQPNVSSTYPI